MGMFNHEKYFIYKTIIKEWEGEKEFQTLIDLKKLFFYILLLLFPFLGLILFFL